MSSAEKTPGEGRGANGRFGKGHKLATGRPKGSRNKTTVLAEQLIHKSSGVVVRKLVALAAAGDPAAMKLCIERIIPAPKMRPTAFTLKKGPVTAASLAEAYTTILRRVAAGEVAPDEAAVLFGALEQVRNAIVTADLEKRVEETERASMMQPPEVGVPAEPFYIGANPPGVGGTKKGAGRG